MDPDEPGCAHDWQEPDPDGRDGYTPLVCRKCGQVES